MNKKIFDEFEKIKIDILSKEDKSFIGRIDPRIQKLCDAINNQKNIFTLSTCSGRVCILETNVNNNKKLSNWLTVTHDLADFNIFNKVLTDYNGENILYFRQESAILHVCVKTIEMAEDFIKIAKLCGFNRCSIISIADKKISVEIIHSLIIQVPIYDKEILITEKYLNYLIELGNRKQEKTWETLEKLRLKILEQD